MTAIDVPPSVAAHNAATLAAAHIYIERGWFPLALHGVIDLPGGGTACTCSKGADPDHLGSQGKHPLAAGWTSQTEPDLTPWDRRTTLPTNVGVVTGNKSGFFVIDVDTVQGWRDLQAMGDLPSTHASKTGGGGFQLYYQMPPGLDITNRDKNLPAGVDVRGNGGMVVAPPSRSGKGSYSVRNNIPPAPSSGWLLDALTKPVRPAAAKPAPMAHQPAAGSPARPQTRRERKLEASIISGEVQRLLDLPQPWYEGARWDATTFEVSCQLVELANAPWSALTPEEAHTMVLQHAPSDAYWNEAEAKFASARTKIGDKPRPAPTANADPADVTDPFSPGHVPTGPGDAMVALPAGEAPAQTVMPTPAQPVEVARRLLADLWTHDGRPTLLRHRGMFHLWADTHWTPAEMDALRSRVYLALEGAVYWKVTKDGSERVPWQPNKSSVTNIVDALIAPVHLDSEVDGGTWLDGRPSGPAIALANGVVDVATRQVSAHSPLYFNLWSLPYEYRPDAPPPVRWLAFIEEVLGDEPGAIECLQEWFGYVLSGRTDLQKMLLILGPTRSGKGTISRVLIALVGARNVAAPSLSSMSSHFGLAPLIGKPLAVIADARVAMRSTRTAVEALLKIVGEDAQTIDRKNISTWTGTLGSRLMILANEPPSFLDASGAVAARFVVISMARSFLGDKADPELGAKLVTELPGILNWSLDGLDRLTKRGRFTQPAGSVDAVEGMRRDGSLVAAFIADRCVVGPQFESPKDELFRAYNEWARNVGERPADSSSAWFRDLYAVDREHIKASRPRDGGGRRQVVSGVALGHKCVIAGCENRSSQTGPLGTWFCPKHTEGGL